MEGKDPQPYVSKLERYSVGLVSLGLGLYILWSLSYDPYGLLAGLFFSAVGFVVLVRKP